MSDKMPCSAIRPVSRAGFFLLLASLAVLVLSAPLQAAEWRFEGVRRVVAISDVHGAFDDMVATLQQAGVLDRSLGWSGAATHLVITGDLLDRGADSRRVMDLLMQLERESVAAGGRVHVLLGNHEVMNLVGDLRYVADAEFAAFAEEESVQQRRYWSEHYAQQRAPGEDAATANITFGEKAPPGFFGHRHAFHADGDYGSWLLSKPLMIVINDTAYVHGGLPPYVAEHGLDGVNVLLKTDVVDFLRIRSGFEEAAILSPVDGFREVPAILERFLVTDIANRDQSAGARELIGLSESPVHHSSGPLWYRGSSRCGRFVEGDRLGAALAHIGARRVVVGHTTTSSRQVQQRLDGRVIEINTGMLKPSYGGNGFALIIEGEGVSVSSQDGTQGMEPIVLPRRVGHELPGLDDDQLEQLLPGASVRGSSLFGNGPRLLNVSIGELTADAQFFPAGDDIAIRPELAAYRLDRLLRLDMVPVTVPYTFGGTVGSLQLLPTEHVSERERFSRGIEADGVCDLERQVMAMRVFDALAGNSARPPSSMLYDEDRWQLLLVGHSAAFDRRGDLHRPDKSGVAQLGGEWRKALRELDDRRLLEALQDVLDARQLAALAERRDRLLELEKQR